MKQKERGRKEWGRGWGGGYSLYRILRPKSKLTKQKESGRKEWGWGEGGGGVEGILYIG